jgi:hypothetical protein
MVGNYSNLSPRSGIGGMDWIYLAQDSNRGRAVVNAVKKTPDSTKYGRFLEWLRAYYLVKDSAP